MWRRWLSGRRRYETGRSAVATAADVWERAGQVATASLPVMAEVEAFALGIYGMHGLPTQPGHYRRGPAAEGWLYLGEHVDANLRWAMVLEMPPESGWRYATLEDIGRYDGAPADLRAASNLLATCRHLKNRLAGREPGNPSDDIETAIRLGADWRTLADTISLRGKSRLKLTTPTDAAPDLFSNDRSLPGPEGAPSVPPSPAKRARPKSPN